MRIAIEAQRIFRSHKHGMDFVVLEILKVLQREDTLNEYFVMVAPGEDKCLESSNNFHVIEFGSTFYPLWEQIQLPLKLRTISPDILHCTSNTAPIIKCATNLVTTIHDVIYLEKQSEANKSWYQRFGRIYRRLVVPRIAKYSETIITVSKFEKKRIAHSFPLKNNSIEVIYNGYGEHFRVYDEWEKVVKKYSDAQNYFLFLGNTDPKKNVETTLIAYHKYLQTSTFKQKLLIADLKNNEFERIIKTNNIEAIREYVHLIGYVPNNDLPYLYNGASIFLYTSKRESFGIPILEAMACGTPVVTGMVSAMPEIAGESCETLVDTFNSDSIANKLIELEENSEFYSKQVDYGKERAKKFSWEKSTLQILDLYQNLYSH